VKHSAMLLMALASGAAASTASADDWRHGIGTALFGLNVQGDGGFGTQLFGPVQAEVDLNSSDISDLTKSAFGFAGFSTNRTWTINYGAKRLQLEDDSRGATAGGTPVAASFDFEAVGADLSAAYRFAGDDRNSWSVLGGLSYTKHDYEVGLSVGTLNTVRTVENDWTDVVLGLVYSLGISSRTSWTTRLDAGFGGSEGTYHFATGVFWSVGAKRQWLLGLYGDFKAVEFENGSPGDADWYLYDVDEFGPGFAFSYVF
jgi:hypothetical protein